MTGPSKAERAAERAWHATRRAHDCDPTGSVMAGDPEGAFVIVAACEAPGCVASATAYVEVATGEPSTGFMPRGTAAKAFAAEATS